MKKKLDKKLLDKAISSLSVQDVYLYECNAAIKGGFDPVNPKYEEVEVQFRHHPKSSHLVNVDSGDGNRRRILRVQFETACRLLPPNLDRDAGEDTKDKSSQILAEITAVFLADYLITDESYNDEGVEEFCVYNVGYHVWPYWRELAQSVATRMRLPPVILPFYRVPKIDAVDVEDVEKESTQ